VASASIHEPGSLVDPSRTNPALPEGHPFTNIETEVKGYWSATMAAEGGSSAWAISFYDGFIGFGGIEVPSHVWCVRGASNADRY
jgi:Protein of unknown function (DUF1566)